MSKNRVRPLARSRRYGVGKEIGGAVYVHRSYEDRLGTVVEQARVHLPRDFEYTVVKYRLDSSVVSFIHSPDFDTNPEPTIGDIWIVYPSGRAQFRRQPSDPYIYHHKWLFVEDDYGGFDVAESRARSAHWTALPDVDRNRIGSRSYWVAVVVPRLVEEALDQGNRP